MSELDFFSLRSTVSEHEFPQSNGRVRELLRYCFNNTSFSMNISVAMAVHNGQAYLEEQLDSLLEQTLAPLEIVVSDDGSSDNTVAIVKKYAERSKRIKLTHCAAQGINKNFTNALTACKGPYIAISDQDDIWHRDKLAQLAAAWHDSTLLAYGSSELIDENNRPLAIQFASQLCLDTFRQGHQPLFFIFSNCVSGHSMMIAKQLLESALPFPTSCMYDHWLALVASVKSDIIYAPQATTYHRIHSSNTINNTKKNSARKRKAPRALKFVKFSAQRQATLERLEKGLQEGASLSEGEKLSLQQLKEGLSRLEDRFFDRHLFRHLFSLRRQLFHGKLLKECRNKAIGGLYFRLLDSISNRL